MDLFEDLPEPGATMKVEQPSVVTKKEKEIKSCGIFSDLPPPVSQKDNKVAKRLAEDDGNLPIKKSLQDSYELHGFSAQRKGEREEMQDYHVIIDDYRKDIPHFQSTVSRMSLYAVFDGHGGKRAARFTQDNLRQNLTNALLKVDPLQIERDIKRAILEAFKKTDEDFLKIAKSSKPSWKDGTTAILILVLDNVLYIANIGDSKAVLCRRSQNSVKPVTIPLSKDHNPTDYTERMRIQKAGGYVRDGRVMGILEVSRSIGDGQYKTLGVTCVPDVKRCQLSDDDRFVILACDGLWKVFMSEEVSQAVLSCTKKKVEDGITSSEICYETACNRLVSEAVRKQSGDNVTVVLVSIKNTKS